MEQKGAETASSRNSGRDSLHVANQSVERTKTPASSATSSVACGCLDRRSATITRAEFEQQASASQIQEESSGLGASRKRTFSQSTEDQDPDLEQDEIRSREDSPAYLDTIETIKKWLDLEVKDVECLYLLQFFLEEIRLRSLFSGQWHYLWLSLW